jgi:hypothetical protein
MVAGNALLDNGRLDGLLVLAVETRVGRGAGLWDLVHRGVLVVLGVVCAVFKAVWVGVGSALLGRNLFGGEEATAWASWATHGVFVARLVEVRLSGMRWGVAVSGGFKRTLRCLDRRWTSSRRERATRRFRMRKYCFALT